MALDHEVVHGVGVAVGGDAGAHIVEREREVLDYRDIFENGERKI